jgi:hypothetical protein
MTRVARSSIALRDVVPLQVASTPGYPGLKIGVVEILPTRRQITGVVIVIIAAADFGHRLPITGPAKHCDIVGQVPEVSFLISANWNITPTHGSDAGVAHEVGCSQVHVRDLALKRLTADRAS